MGRIRRELATLEQMLIIRCGDRHEPPPSPGQGAVVLCASCRALLGYLAGRLEACPWGDGKPVCGRCRTPCFDPAARAELRAIMAHAGPRMLVRHPFLALRHLLDLLPWPRRQGPTP